MRRLPWPSTVSVGEPKRNKSYREAHFPKRKSDVTDSFSNARYAVVEQPASTDEVPAEFHALREVAGQLEAQVTLTSRLVNQLHNRLARAFPELATLASDLSSEWVLTLLARYPTPQKIAHARLDSLKNIPYVPKGKPEAIQKSARSSVGSLQGKVAEELIRQQVAALRQSLAAETRLRKLLQEAYEALPPSPHQKLESIPGIGPITAAALVAKVISINRFATPAQLVSYFGVFPEERSSGVGKSGQPNMSRPTSMSRQGNDLVRKCLWNAAKNAITHNPAVRALYANSAARGKRGDVALGHCMRKLLHLAFVVWKTGREFDPQHYPWDQVGATEKEAPAGHNKGHRPSRKVVTAGNSKIDSGSLASNPPRRPRSSDTHPTKTATSVDFAEVRRQVSMLQVLEQLGHLKRLRGNGTQRRGPCPLHAAEGRHNRSFSVHLAKNIFQCFHPQCAAQGNVLDLWAAVHKLPLREAAMHLAQTFHISINSNREEEPVRNSKPR